MEKLPRVYVVPQDEVDCNQLQSLIGQYCKSWSGGFRVGQLNRVLLNIGIAVHTDTYREPLDIDPIVSINELARQLRLWAI